jgi:hypothetical protein
MDKLFDETGGKIGMRQVHVKTPKHGTKSFGENLAYLPRFLAANVGRKWDDIYSEIAATFDKRSTVNAHIFQHLFDYFVPAHEVIFIRNRPHAIHIYSRQAYPIYSGGYRGLYVDPRSGILKEGMKESNKSKQTKAQVAAKSLLEFKRILSPLVELHKLDDGMWYVFELKKIPSERIVEYVYAPPFPKDFDSQQEWYKGKKEFDLSSKEVKTALGRRVEKAVEFKTFNNKIESNRQSQLVNRPYNRDTRSYGVATHYYASMRSASKKELRTVGL